MAHYDEESVVVYQAYSPAIGEFASQNGYFGGDFKYTRMSWIKPNFLWMMYRSGWGTKPDQETTLAIRLKRSAFGQLLRDAVRSSFDPSEYETREEWKAAVDGSDVRLQWDPDHDPTGEKQERRAIQLGLRGKTLESYGREWILEIEDISGFVREQRAFIEPDQQHRLVMPTERVYPVTDERVSARLGLSEPSW